MKNKRAISVFLVFVRKVSPSDGFQSPSLVGDDGRINKTLVTLSARCEVEEGE